jgi:acetate kinase
MNVLVFNCGSSSLKYALLEMPSERFLARGEAQRVGPKTSEPSRLVHSHDGRTETVLGDMPDHAAAFNQVMRLIDQGSAGRVDAIAHRVVHGGSHFDASTLLDEEADAALDEVSDLAPIHNPPALALIRKCRSAQPTLPEVLVFDTSFHTTIPDAAKTYALPAKLRQSLGLRKYGFHGISHKYVATQAALLLGRPLSELNLVSCHLGTGGASLCAIVGGRSVDNTMGYTPLQGLIMSTRCGDLDPAVALQLVARHGGDHEAVERILNKKSGVLGLSGFSADIRDVAAAGGAGPLDIATQSYLWRIRKYLGAYLTAAAPVGAIIFTDTVGENVPFVRSAVCGGLTEFGIDVDEASNYTLTKLPADIATAQGRVRVLVIATNEELAIAREAWGVLHKKAPIRAEESVSCVS